MNIKDGSSNDVVTYTYDALGRRIRMEDHITAANSRWYYYSDGWQVLEEYNTDATPTLEAYYVWGNYIDELLFIWNADSLLAGQVLSDHLHSPTAILNITDGSILERYEYDAYGKVTVYTNMNDWDTSTPTTQSYSAKGNPYTFTGRRLDRLDNGDFEVMYYRNRYYDTETGRFLQKDPAGYVDGMNLYQYVASMPIVYSDPMGFDLVYPGYPSGGKFPDIPNRNLCDMCETAMLGIARSHLDEAFRNFIGKGPRKDPWILSEDEMEELFSEYDLDSFILAEMRNECRVSKGWLSRGGAKYYRGAKYISPLSSDAGGWKGTLNKVNFEWLTSCGCENGKKLFKWRIWFDDPWEFSEYDFSRASNSVRDIITSTVDKVNKGLDCGWKSFSVEGDIEKLETL